MFFWVGFSATFFLMNTNGGGGGGGTYLKVILL